MKGARLLLALALLAGCNLNTPPHATSWLPTCLLFCFSRVEVTDQSTSTQARYARPAKPASAVPVSALVRPDVPVIAEGGLSDLMPETSGMWLE